MKVNQSLLFFRIAMILTSSVCLAIIWNNSAATTSNSNKQQNDSTIVYYSYYSNEAEYIFIPEQDTSIVEKPDILIIGEILDSKDLSHTIIDTLDDGWLKHTNYQIYTYTVKVNYVLYGVCSNDHLEITVTSGSQEERKTRFSHISEKGDSVFEVFVRVMIPYCETYTNKRIPVGEVCIFHFKKGDLSVVEYISSYSKEELKNYMIKSGLETEN